MSRDKIIIVERAQAVAIAFASCLERAGYSAIIVDSSEKLLEISNINYNYKAIIIDSNLADEKFLKYFNNIYRNIPFVITSKDASLSCAVDAMRIGAFDYLVKPVAENRLVSVIRSAVESGLHATTKAVLIPPSNFSENNEAGLKPFIGNSVAMHNIYNQITCVSRSRVTVLITGESGTGKEVCAESIHRKSTRGKGPFVAINCGSIPENLLESELFGHLKGSFTGAVSDRIGAVQTAHKGTLFLDEICEMPLQLQVKLLRFLQSGSIKRVGSSRVEEVDVRIVCATNRNPLEEVEAGRFREDLYYRLAVLPIHMPPLREREGDLELLAQAFLQRFATEEGKRFDHFNSGQLATLSDYHWPGNVRQLQNVVRRATVLHDGPTLPHDALVCKYSQKAFVPIQRAIAQTPNGDFHDAIDRFDNLTLNQIETIIIEKTIRKFNGNIQLSANHLGVNQSTIYRKLEKHEKIKFCA